MCAHEQLFERFLQALTDRTGYLHTHTCSLMPLMPVFQRPDAGKDAPYRWC